MTNNILMVFINILLYGKCSSLYKLVFVACPVPTCLTVTDLNGLCPNFSMDEKVKVAENALENRGKCCVCVFLISFAEIVCVGRSVEEMGVSRLECLLIRTGLQNMLL